MRIGELDDSVGKETAVRRDAAATTLARLGQRLAEPVIPATKPAVSLADSVRISAEARAAQFAKAAGALPLPPFPSPVELVAALKVLATAKNPAEVAAATAQLAEFVRKMAASFSAPAAMAGARESDAVAEVLVRQLLGHGQPASRQAAPVFLPDPPEVVWLVRRLLATLPSVPRGDGLPSAAPTQFERVAVAILIALTRVGAGERTDLHPTVPHEPAPFPAVLLGLLGAPRPAFRRPRTRRPKASDDEGDFQEDDLEKAAADQYPVP